VDGTFPTDLGSAWSFGASLLTFIAPMCLFIIVATILFVQYSRPHEIPGHKSLMLAAGRAGSAEPTPEEPQPADSGLDAGDAPGAQ
jgi:hypothetical protein